LSLEKYSKEILLLIFILSYTIRVCPYVSSGVPYHTDSWPMIRNIEVLVENSPTPLDPKVGFDSYNIFWPGLIFFGGLTSVLLHVPPITLMPLLSPLVSSISVLMFFVLLRKLKFDVHSSLAATLIFGSGAILLIGAGVTKQGFAFPLCFMLLILSVSGPSVKTALLSVTTILTLTISHHLTSVITLFLMFLLTTSRVLFKGEQVNRRISILILSAFSVFLYCYIFLYARNITLIELKEADIISLVSYIIVATAPLLLNLFYPEKFTKVFQAWVVFLFLGVITLTYLSFKVNVELGAPVASFDLAPLTLSYILIGFLVVLCVFLTRESLGHGLSFFLLWMLGLLGVVSYTIFGTPGLTSITLRLSDFLYPSLMVPAAYTLVTLAKRNSALKFLSVVLLMAIAISSAFILPYTAFYSGTFGGSQRVYTQSDIAVSNWVVSNSLNGSNLYGDVRFSYVIQEYFGREVKVNEGFNYLVMGKNPPLGLLLMSSTMLETGYITFVSGTSINETLFTYNNDTRVCIIYSSNHDKILLS